MAQRNLHTAPGSSLALNEAVKLNSEALVKSLIEADANPQLKDGLNETAIECHLDHYVRYMVRRCKEHLRYLRHHHVFFGAFSPTWKTVCFHTDHIESLTVCNRLRRVDSAATTWLVYWRASY